MLGAVLSLLAVGSLPATASARSFDLRIYAGDGHLAGSATGTIGVTNLGPSRGYRVETHGSITDRAPYDAMWVYVQATWILSNGASQSAVIGRASDATPGPEPFDDFHASGIWNYKVRGCWKRGTTYSCTPWDVP